MPYSAPSHKPKRFETKQHEVEVAKKQEKERGTACQRGYDRTWAKVRLLVLAEEPICRFCKESDPPRYTPAVEVDHIIPISEDPSRRLDRTNLRPLCKSCHSSRTARDQSWGRR